MKASALAVAVLLAGCETMRTIAPQTTTGFERGGVFGALDGASGAILARCRLLDGEVLRGAIDQAAADTGTGDALADIRARRRQLCAVLGAVNLITGHELDLHERRVVPAGTPAG